MFFDFKLSRKNTLTSFIHEMGQIVIYFFRGNVMLSKKKWMLAILLVFLFIVMDKFEKNDVLSTNYSNTLLAPQKPTEIYQKVREWITPNEDVVTVSAPLLENPVLEYSTIQPYGQGAVLSISASQKIGASENGLIIFTGYTKKTGKTISILYDNGETVTYGFLEEFYQLPYTTVNAGDIFASVKRDILYVQVEKDGETLETTDIVDWLATNYEE